MLVREMVEALQALPQDLPLWTASDDEGNQWFEVGYYPQVSWLLEDGRDSSVVADEDIENGEYEMEDLVRVVSI